MEVMVGVGEGGGGVELDDVGAARGVARVVVDDAALVEDDAALVERDARGFDAELAAWPGWPLLADGEPTRVTCGADTDSVTLGLTALRRGFEDRVAALDGVGARSDGGAVAPCEPSG
ncbi:MAG: hypothetical protein ACRC35_12045 [Angustibacter sp.]